MAVVATTTKQRAEQPKAGRTPLFRAAPRHSLPGKAAEATAPKEEAEAGAEVFSAIEFIGLEDATTAGTQLRTVGAAARSVLTVHERTHPPK